MHKEPLISILTLVYNQAQYIEQTIRSVLNQTYRNWEWIILDDGSTDGTGDIIKSFKDSRIGYTHQEHKGIQHLAKTYNRAFSFCNGIYIAMLDGDDYWPDYKLEVQNRGFDKPDIVLSYGECTVVNHHNKKIASMSIPEDVNIARNDPIGSALHKFIPERFCFIHTSTVMLKKQALINLGGFIEAEGLFHDFPTWVRLSIEGKFSVFPVCLGYWRRHSSSVVLQADQERLFDAGINFLRVFLRQNEGKLHELGLLFDIDALDNIWREEKKVFLEYLPFNRTMLMLEFGLFKEALQEFEKFLKQHPSMKHQFIALLIKLSRLLKIDIVHPIMALKSSALRIKIQQDS
jgi:glycosyltransferase involved in cell wall biosynthesis